MTTQDYPPATGGLIFYRTDESGNAALLYAEDGSVVTRLNEDVYPVDSALSARYEHPAGIVLSVADAESLGIKPE